MFKCLHYGEVYLEEAAFQKLMIRFLKIVLEGAKTHASIRQYPWWAECEELIQQLITKSKNRTLQIYVDKNSAPQ